MRSFWIGAGLLCAFVASAGAQVISPNEGRADEVIREQCERQWPTDFSTRATCIDIQQEARRKLQQSSATDHSSPGPLVEKTEPGGVPLFDQGPFKPARIHDGYNRPLRRDYD